MSTTPRHALVFGASGISGWGAITQLLSYPTKDTWHSVVGLTNRPLTKSAAYLPDDDRLSLISGMDLSGSSESVIKALKAKVPGIGNVTHIFFYSYIHEPKAETMFVANARLVENTLLAAETLCPKLEHYILQTGGKTYGLGYDLELPSQPWKEVDSRSKHPEIQKELFYYPQVDLVAKHAKTANWTWSEVIPDAIIGFAPTANAMNLARSIGIYLTMYRSIHGEGVDVPFPGSQGGYECLSNLSSMDSIARFSIWAALNPSKTDGNPYNITERASTWAKRWPTVTAPFGLKGTAPGPKPVDFTAFATENASVWAELETKHGLKSGALEDEKKSGGWEFLEAMIRHLTMDREYDNTARFEAGYTEDMDVLQGFKDSWREFVAIKVLPPL